MAIRNMTSSTPLTEIPKREEDVVGRERRRRVWSRSSVAVGSVVFQQMEKYFAEDI